MSKWPLLEWNLCFFICEVMFNNFFFINLVTYSEYFYSIHSTEAASWVIISRSSNCRWSSTSTSTSGNRQDTSIGWSPLLYILQYLVRKNPFCIRSLVSVWPEWFFVIWTMLILFWLVLSLQSFDCIWEWIDYSLGYSRSSSGCS